MHQRSRRRFAIIVAHRLGLRARFVFVNLAERLNLSSAMRLLLRNIAVQDEILEREKSAGDEGERVFS
jgi:hypothetical protein